MGDEQQAPDAKQSPESDHESPKINANDTGVTLVETEVEGEYMDPQTGDLYNASGQRLGKQHPVVNNPIPPNRPGWATPQAVLDAIKAKKTP